MKVSVLSVPIQASTSKSGCVSFVSAPWSVSSESKRVGVFNNSSNEALTKLTKLPATCSTQILS